MIPLIMLAIFANRVVFDINENSRLRLNCKPKSVHPILRPSPTQPITSPGAPARPQGPAEMDRALDPLGDLASV